MARLTLFFVLAALLAYCAGLAAAASYSNPVLVPNSPDPGVVHYNGRYYAVTTTNGAGELFPIHVSSDLVNWKHIGYVFPAKSHTKPHWAVSDFWAPELHIVKGVIRVYFVARDTTGLLCVGVATSTSSSPLGPYKDLGHPLVRNETIGSIDPTLYQHEVQSVDADGRVTSRTELLLYWKSDGNAIGKPTIIWVQPLTDDGLALAPHTQQKELLRNDLHWEGICIEGPWVVKRAGWYYLFYSGNMYDSHGPDGTCLYSVGVARSASPTGPFVKRGDPILHASLPNRFTGPGHCSVVPFRTASGEESWYMVYHAWSVGAIAGGNPRHMLTDKVEWAHGWPSVYKGYPSYTEQPTP